VTVVLITSIRTFVGVSGDTKPTDAPAGSTFYETDTRTIHVYNGSAWSAKLADLS
jgi:hypothetical protein